MASWKGVMNQDDKCTINRIQEILVWFSTAPCLFLISVISLSRKNTEETLFGGESVLEAFRRS